MWLKIEAKELKSIVNIDEAERSNYEEKSCTNEGGRGKKSG
jgi:hypothetical protein